MTQETAPSRAAMLDQTEGDLDLLRVLAASWIGQVDALLSEAERGIDEDEADTTMRAAHTIKGAAGVFAADWLVERAARLEQVTKDGAVPPEARALLAEVTTGSNALTATLQGVLDEAQAG